MTTQIPNKLINDHSVDLRNLDPYWIVSDSGDSKSCFPALPEVTQSEYYCSAVMQGFIAAMRLHTDGQLELIQFEFPFSELSPQVVNMMFKGDFHITFRPFFEGPSTSIPFRNGVIVSNRNEWEIDEQAISVEVVAIEKAGDSGDFAGLMVQHLAAWKWWMPANLIPSELHDSIDQYIGTTIDCLIVERCDQKGIFVVKPSTVLENFDTTLVISNDVAIADKLYWRVDRHRREGLSYSDEKLLLRDSAVKPPKRINDKWWLVYKNDEYKFKIACHQEHDLYRATSHKGADVEFSNIAQLFTWLDL